MFWPAQVQVTVPPLWITALPGLNTLSFTDTAADVGGADAVAVNVTGAARPLNVAVTVCGLVEPMLSAVAATPVVPVVLWVGLTAPPPDATAQFTTTPGTAQLFASRAVTFKAEGSGLLKYQAGGFPLVFTSCVAGPGVQGPVPPPPSPPQASNSPTPSAGNRSQRMSRIASSYSRSASKENN